MNTVHISLAAEPVAHVGSFVITNSMLTSLVGSLVVFGLFYLAAQRASLKPTGGIAHVIESVVEAILNLIEEVTQDRAKAIWFFPLLMTFFSFILINNWLGLLPGVGTITTTSGGEATPLFRAATADLNTTFALGIISVIVGQLYAIRSLGLFKHLKKYVSLNPVLLFVGFLEFVGEFTRMISFSFRLFGNVFAGEVLLAVMGFLVPLLAPLPFFALEIFVGFIQALVFTMLSLVFLEIATSDHSDHGSAEVSLPQTDPQLSADEVSVETASITH